MKQTASNQPGVNAQGEMMKLDGEHGKKHIARLERRANALEARFMASPNQADFDDERAELKSLRWAIDQLRAAPAASGDELVARLRDEASAGRSELAKLPLELPQADIFRLAMGNLFDLMDEAAAALARSEVTRSDVIEECAKVCDKSAAENDQSDKTAETLDQRLVYRGAKLQAEKCAAAIRSLK